MSRVQGHCLSQIVSNLFTSPLEGKNDAADDRSEVTRVQPPRHIRPPVDLDYLLLRPAAVALRVCDNMLHRRPANPKLLRDCRGPETSIKGGVDQPFLSRGRRGDPFRIVRPRASHLHRIRIGDRSGVCRGVLALPGLRATICIPVLPLRRTDFPAAPEDRHRLGCER